MSPGQRIALGCVLTVAVLLAGSAFVVHRVVSTILNVSFDVGGIGPVISAGINEALARGDKEQRLAVLASLEQAGRDAALFSGAID